MRAALAELGLSAGGYALYNVALDTIFVSVFAAVAIVIFWRRSDDPVALLVATMLVVWGPLNGLFVLTPGAIEGSIASWGRRSGRADVHRLHSVDAFLLPLPERAFRAALDALAGAGLRRFLFRSLELHAVRPASWPPPLFTAAVLAVWGSFPVAQIYRYARVSDPIERQQTKWVVFGVAVAVVGTLATIFTVGAAVDLPPREVGSGC